MANTVTVLIPGSLLTAVAAVYYTVPSTVPTKTVIQAMTVTNNDGAMRTITIHLVPSGGNADTTNKIVAAETLAPSQTKIVHAALGKALGSGGTIQALASAAAVVNLQATGVEFT